MSDGLPEDTLVSIDFNQQRIKDVEHLLKPETMLKLKAVRALDESQVNVDVAAYLIVEIIDQTGISIEVRRIYRA